MLAQKPAVTELVVPLDQLDPIALSQAQFVGAPGLKVICNCALISNTYLSGNAGAGGDRACGSCFAPSRAEKAASRSRLTDDEKEVADFRPRVRVAGPPRGHGVGVERASSECGRWCLEVQWQRSGSDRGYMEREL